MVILEKFSFLFFLLILHINHSFTSLPTTPYIPPSFKYFHFSYKQIISWKNMESFCIIYFVLFEQICKHSRMSLFVVLIMALNYEKCEKSSLIYFFPLLKIFFSHIIDLDYCFCSFNSSQFFPSFPTLRTCSCSASN